MNMPKPHHPQLDLVIDRVQTLFTECPDLAHGFDHAERVAAHAAHIAYEEGEDIVIPTLAGWLHDIGRTVEEYPDKFSAYDSSIGHHENSYKMLQQWFRQDSAFDIFSDDQKLELLYAVRWHWNDSATDYMSAMILRDADKIDGLGEIGMMRSRVHNRGNEKKRHLDIRLRYEWMYHFETETGKRLRDEMNLIDPFEEERDRVQASAIVPIEL